MYALCEDSDCTDASCDYLHDSQWDKTASPNWLVEGVNTFSANAEREAKAENKAEVKEEIKFEVKNEIKSEMDEMKSEIKEEVKSESCPTSPRIKCEPDLADDEEGA